jgi:hypothetical protein
MTWAGIMGLFIGMFYSLDWFMIGELVSPHDFLGLLYSQRVDRDKEDRLCWLPTRSGLFKVKSFYKVLTTRNTQVFLWKSIWKAKVPIKVASFAWTAAQGRF